MVSVDLNAKSFVMQGPHGRHFTVVTNDQTQWGPDGETLNSLDTNTIVQVSGSLQRNSLTLTATEVVVLTRERFLLGGLLTDVRPPTGAANEIDLFVRSELPDLTNAPVGQIATLTLDGNERFWIYEFRIPMAAFLFNREALVRGQRISAGGLLDTSVSPPKLDVRRVVLHRQGLEGAWVPGSTNLAAGTFTFNASGLAGVIFNQPVKVVTSPFTRWVGLRGLIDLTGNTPIRLRVVGLVLKDLSGNPVIVARVVEKL
ncbi:MAG: hypothetical protein HY237_03210 [Acidobacteria bacterium]|nr:hypothetical protein [Acidobacteriota bacterium]